MENKIKAIENEIQIAFEKAKSEEKEVILTVATYLKFRVYPSDYASWEVRIQQKGKEYRKVIGNYPEMTIKGAFSTLKAILDAKGINKERIRILPKRLQKPSQEKTAHEIEKPIGQLSFNFDEPQMSYLDYAAVESMKVLLTAKFYGVITDDETRIANKSYELAELLLNARRERKNGIAL